MSHEPRTFTTTIGDRTLEVGTGLLAFRDVASFFKNEKADEAGTPNPVAGNINWAITRGVSQSGNFIRGFLHLGFNEDEAGRQVYDGAWPIIAGKRIALNVRFAMPDGAQKLYEAGAEGPQWWIDWPDPVRHLPTKGILDRCTATNSCPKIIEHFGGRLWVTSTYGAGATFSFLLPGSCLVNAPAADLQFGT